MLAVQLGKNDRDNHAQATDVISVSHGSVMADSALVFLDGKKGTKAEWKALRRSSLLANLLQHTYRNNSRFANH